MLYLSSHHFYFILRGVVLSLRRMSFCAEKETSKKEQKRSKIFTKLKTPIVFSSSRKCLQFFFSHYTSRLSEEKEGEKVSEFCARLRARAHKYDSFSASRPSFNTTRRGAFFVR